MICHYDWLEENLMDFFAAIGVNHPAANVGMIVSHGDKGYCFQDYWEENGIPFPHGMAILMVSYIQPYSREICQTPTGWVDPKVWVKNNYRDGYRFSEKLPEI